MTAAQYKINETNNHKYGCSKPALKLKILVIISMDFSKLSALKNIQQKDVKAKVKMIDITLPIIDGCFLSLFVSFIQILCTASANPCNKPQNTYVQFAPCQIPPITIVNMRFR